MKIDKMYYLYFLFSVKKRKEEDNREYQDQVC